MIWFGFRIVYFILMSFVVVNPEKFVFKINGDIDEIAYQLSVLDFEDMKKITPSVYSFKYAGSLTNTTIQAVLVEVKQRLGDKIVEVEQVKVYTKIIPVDTRTVTPDERHGSFLPLQSKQMNVERSNYFGMHVEDAWNKGFNGSGITVAVTDIGINPDITDLRRNLNMEMAYNFMKNSTDVTPEDIQTSYKAETIRYIDHGNKCASIIAAEKGNNLCNAGIAYDAKIVPLKIFSLLFDRKYFFKLNKTDAMATVLTYRLDDIHIFSNSWSPSTLFGPLDLAVREAILHGALTGRNKLGTIYVVPDGSDGITGSGMANSLHTIAVNGVGVGGTLPKNAKASACVITSGLSDGNKLHTNHMMTSSYNNACVGTFKGVSAAVAEISAVIALILQARPTLTIRDIQLLLADSSDREGLAESINFHCNGAGKYFHAVFGFGLLNADKAVTLAKKWRHVGKLYNNSLQYLQMNTIEVGKHQHSVKMMTVIEFRMEADFNSPHVNTIEHVVLRIGYTIISQEGILIDILSPHKTESVIVDNTGKVNIDKDPSPRYLTSVHFLGESPIGIWKVRIQSNRNIDTKNFPSETSLRVFGTFNDTKRIDRPKGTFMTDIPVTSEDSKRNDDRSQGSTEAPVAKSTEKSAASKNQLYQMIMYIIIDVMVIMFPSYLVPI